MTVPVDTASDAGSDASGPVELSGAAMAALNEFLKERADAEAKFEALRAAAERAEQARKTANDEIDDSNVDNVDVAAEIDMDDFREDWQLSQFWYSDATRDTLAREALAQTHPGARIGCISSPSAFVTLRRIVKSQSQSNPLSNRDLFVFEFDKRFNVYGSEFVFYDFNTPIDFDDINGTRPLHATFDFLIVDPPFLSQECWTKTAQTVRYLLKPDTGKVLVCTGQVMAPLVCQQLACTQTRFLPQHRNGLKNEFRSFVNYKNSQSIL